MSNQLRHEVASLLPLIRIHTPNSFEFAGKTFAVGGEMMAQGSSFAAGQSGQLQSVLYSYAYAKVFKGQIPPDPAPQPYDPAFVQKLMDANQSQVRWDHGWQVYSVQADGSVYAKKGDRQRSARPGEYVVPASPGSALQAGATIQIYMPKDSTTLQPGFYHVFSETPADIWDDYSTTRFYFHIRAAGAPALVRFLTSTLNRYLTPFRFKTLTQASMYDRTDAAVLYVARRYHPLIQSMLEALPEDVSRELGPEVPRFSRWLKPGIGTVEDPGNGESFGMQRCRIIAEGLIDAFNRGIVSDEGRMETIAAHYVRNGLDPERPHLARKGGDFPVVLAEVVFAHA